MVNVLKVKLKGFNLYNTVSSTNEYLEPPHSILSVSIMANDKDSFFSFHFLTSLTAKWGPIKVSPLLSQCSVCLCFSSHLQIIYMSTLLVSKRQSKNKSTLLLIKKFLSFLLLNFSAYRHLLSLNVSPLLLYVIRLLLLGPFSVFGFVFLLSRLKGRFKEQRRFTLSKVTQTSRHHSHISTGE